MNLLVTGGLGFIGSNFIRYLLGKKSLKKLVNLDKITYAGNPTNLSGVDADERYHFVKGDICNLELVDYVLKKFEITHLINFAAESHVDRSISNPNLFIETNVVGTQTLLNAAVTNELEMYVQISTDEVYGSLDFHEPAFTEQSPLDPHSPYSASKTAADLLVQAYFHTYKLPIIITRCSNNYGPYQFPEKLIPLMINNIRNKKSLPVYGDGKNIRDWIHVEDHSEGIWHTLQKGKPGEVYNFGGDAEISNIELVKILLQEMGETEELISFVKDRPGHDLRYAMDFSKAKRELGWTPKWNFREGIKATIQWYLNNEQWIQNVTSGAYQEYYKNQYGEKK